jgi:hypothetical protein
MPKINVNSVITMAAILLFSEAAIAAAITSATLPQAEVTSAPTAAYDDSFLPLMAWDDVENTATIKKMADCGINVIAFVPPDLLPACEKYHVKAIVFDPRVTPNWDKPFDSKRANKVLPDIIAKCNASPAVYGYHLKDEPGGDQFPELAKSAALVRKLAPGKWPYINLPPGMGKWYDTSYIQSFVDQCKPPILSYDNYAIGEKVDFSYGFWANIWDMRSAALRNNLPFHVIVLTSAHFNYRVPNDADLRLEVYGSLVYGARGIGYYKFRSRPLAVLGAPDLGNFRGGPLDDFDEKTVTWQYLRNLNRKITNLAPYLLKLHSDDVYHVGTIPEENHGITSSTLVSSLDSGKELIIGDFTSTSDGSRWVMVVNKDLHESTFCRPKFSIPAKNPQYVSPVSGKLTPFSGQWYALAPGQGVLIKLN